MLWFKKMMCLVLTLVMVAGMLPVQALAAELETVAPEETVPEETAVQETAAAASTEETLAETTGETVETLVEETAATEGATVPEEAAPAETEETTAVEEAAPVEPQETLSEETLAEETVSEEVCFSEVSGVDSEALFEEYVKRLFFGDSGISLLSTLAWETLSGADKYLYDQLKAVIVRIAAGEQTSTTVKVELGKAGHSTGAVDLDAVLDALLHDCPYEMYWYDFCYYSFDYRKETVTVWLQVCQNFRARDYTELDPRIDAGQVQRAKNAAENAQAIVARHAGSRDYDKLAAYADEICALVEYDYGAAGGNTFSTDISPWTLVNVFDGDPDTNVVCEGYAESFQYLCDLSTFDREIACYSPTGAYHKWNIVRIDGVSYLMDVTNSDVGETAERGAFFLNGGKGSVKDGYKIGGFHYWYYDETIALWGAGPDSILRLAEKAYDPAKDPEPQAITQEKFELILQKCGGKFELTQEVAIVRDMEIKDVALTIGKGGRITVASDAVLLFAENSALTQTEADQVAVESGGKLIAFGQVEGSITGEGDFLLVQLLDGKLIVAGQGTIHDGDLDSMMGSARTVGPRALEAMEGINGIGANAFDGCISLEEVTLPKSLKTLGARAFADCTGLRIVTFQGDAPEMENPASIFERVTAMVRYPRNNETWTEEVISGLGDNLTFAADCSDSHTVVVIPGMAPTCVDYGIADGAYCSVCGETLAEQTLLLPTGIHTYTDESDTVCDVCGMELVSDTEFPFSKYEWEVLKLTNQKRLAAGVEPLTGFSVLQQAGDIRAAELTKYFSHTRPDGTSCFTVLKELDITYRAAGENIASGYKTPADVVSGWMNSQGHRENMLNPDFTHMGVGEKDRNWVQLFISGYQYASLRLAEGDYLTVDPGTNLNELDMVGVLMSYWGMSYLPICSDYCQGYDPNAVGDQQVTISVLGVSTTVTIHIHDWQAATCTEPKHCASCDLTEGDALGHDYKTVVIEPTCTEEGSRSDTCIRCGDAQNVESIPTLSHEAVVDPAAAPTCEAPGFTEGSHCNRCGEILLAQEEIAALGHSILVDSGYAPTCIHSGLSDGQHCDRCDKVLAEREMIPALGHNFANGTCLNCGREDKGDYTLFSGKTLKLQEIDPDTGKPYTAKQITWALEEGDEAYAILTADGKLSAPGDFEKARVTAIATIAHSKRQVIRTVDIYPAVTQLEVKLDGEAVNGKTVPMDFSEEAMVLTAEAFPVDTLENVTWTVSDKKGQYAEYVIDGGTLTIQNPTGKAGTVTIKATEDAGTKKNVTVKVQFASFAKTLEIEAPAETDLKGGQKLTLTAAITEPDKVTKPGIVWTTSDKTAATVSNGKVTAKNVAHPTDVTITATSKDGRASASIELRILPKNEGQLVLMEGNSFVTNANKAMDTDEELWLSAAVITGGVPVPVEASWSSSKAAVASVDEIGLVTAVASGTAKITAEFDGMKAVVNVKVSTLADSVEITPKDSKNLEEDGTVFLASGKNLSLVASVLPQGANKAVTWAITEGAAYAKIAGGKLTANKDLTSVQYVTVIATAKDGSGASGSVRVKIVPLAAGVQLYREGTRIRANTTYVHDLMVGDTIHLSAKVYPAKAEQKILLTSSNKKIADFEDGKLVCHNTGTVTITAQAQDGSGVKTAFKLTIVKKVTGLTLKEGATLTVVGGKTLKLAPLVQVSPSDATNKKLTWSVAPNDYGIKISTSGVLSTKKVKEAVTVNVMVMAQDGSGKMLSFDVTVTPN